MQSVRKRPALLRALGDGDPPETIVVDGHGYRRATILKHDSWAATALYQDDAGTRVICKFGRTQSIFGIPCGWIGRSLARREGRFLRRLADVDTVPADAGPVEIDGRPAPNALARVYVEGAPLGEGEYVEEEFLDQLDDLIAKMHDRGIAYVDLHKRENVIVGADGRPYLIDFQVSFARPEGWLGRLWPIRAVFSELAVMDRYHVRKHRARCRPDLLSPEQTANGVRPPLSIRIHRLFAVPFRTMRRRLLVALSVRSGKGFAQSELEPEDAYRPSASREDAS